uniref:AIPP2-like SPOC-like domain-containing protein n=1 Tax=Oryza barthii TaxID=65489 RepID=A0A0D3HRP7_9ORYZ
MAYKLPKKGNHNHDENRRGYDDKFKAIIADERTYKWNYLKDKQKKVTLQIPVLYPSKSSIRPPFTQLTDKNIGPMAKGDSKSNHVLAPMLRKEGLLANSIEKSNPQLTSPIRAHPIHALVRTKKGIPARSVLKSNPQPIRPKQMRGSVRGVSLKGQSTMANDNSGEELKSCKVKNYSISKESAKELMVHKGNSYEDNKCDKICGEVTMSDRKHVNLGSTKSLKRDYIPSTYGDHYKDNTKGNEVPNPSPLTKDGPKKHDRDECEDYKNLRPTKKWRRYIVNVDEEDDYDDKNPMDIKDSTKVAMPIAAESIKRQFYHCIQPIDEPIWRGIFKIGGNDYIPFSAHLSTKSCKKVWDLSVSIPSIVQVTKLSRSVVWPKSLEASSPTDDSIGLLDKGMDQLVKEIVEKDMALSAVIGEAQMLMFPSTLLPENIKHYLWGVFKRRGGDEQQAAAMAAEQQRGSDQRVKQEQENTQFQGDETQQRIKKPNSNLQETAVIKQQPSSPSSSSVTAAHIGVDVVQEKSTAASGGRPAVPAGSHGRVIGLVVRQTPGVEELIQQMRRGGALLATMEGEMMGGFEANDDDGAKKFKMVEDT